MSTTLTAVWVTDSPEKKQINIITEREIALHLIMQHSSPVAFTVYQSLQCNGVLCLQRGHSGAHLLLLIIVVHC